MAYIDPLDRDPLIRNKLKLFVPYLKDDSVIELRMNKPQELIVLYDDGRKLFKSMPELTADYMLRLGMILANISGQEFSMNYPILYTKIAGGHRTTIVGYDNTEEQFAMVIRRNRNIEFPLSSFGFSKQDQAAIKKAVKTGKTLLVSGGTGSGKTTLTNCLIPLIPEDHRIVTVEGVAELSVPHKDWLPIYYSENGSAESGISSKEIMRACMRLSPDNILIGELHADNALTFAIAINTGHEGSMATIHANNPKAAIIALISRMIINKDIDQAGIEIMRKQICTDVYGVIQINRHSDGTRTGTFQKLSVFDEDVNFQGDVMQMVKGESSS